MKRVHHPIWITTLLLSAVLTSCISISTGKGNLMELIQSKQEIGNGVMCSKSINLPEHTSLEVDRGVEVRYTHASQQLTVTTHENIMPYVVVTCQLGHLKITIDPALRYVGDLDVVVTIPQNEQLKRIEASSAAEVRFAEQLILGHTLEIDCSSSAEIEGALRAPKVVLNASSAADLSLDLLVEELKAHVSSSASVELKGACTQSELLVTSAAEIDAEELQTTTCRVHASSAGEAEVWCTGELYAEASSAGEINYHGKCQVMKQCSSAGEVQYKGE